MQTVAELVAKERKLPSSDYRDVIWALKREQLVGEAVLPHYQELIQGDVAPDGALFVPFVVLEEFQKLGLRGEPVADRIDVTHVLGKNPATVS